MNDCESCKSLSEARERAKMYKQQLGGTNAALRREQQKVKDLKAENERLLTLLTGRYDHGQGE